MAEVYLLHASAPIGNLDNPYGQAQHYLGCADSLVKRVFSHRKGFGASLTKAFIEQGRSLSLVRVWSGGYQTEKQLKRYKNSPKLCPICSSDAWNRGTTIQTNKERRNKKAVERYELLDFEPLLTEAEIKNLRGMKICHQENQEHLVPL